MEDKNVPYIVYESESARHERTVKRLLQVIIILIVMLVVSNLAWLWVWNQYDFVSESYSVENDGNSNVLGAGASMNGVSNGVEDRVQEEDSN
jgi:hypothetical protein